MSHKSTTFTQASSIYSEPVDNTTGRYTITKHELGYKPYEVFSVHQLSVEMVGSTARWGVKITAPHDDKQKEFTTVPVADGAGAKAADLVTISEVLPGMIIIDMVGLSAASNSSVTIVSRQRGI